MKKTVLILISGLVVLITALLILPNQQDKITEADKELEGSLNFITNQSDKDPQIQELIRQFKEQHPKVEIANLLNVDNEEELILKISTGLYSGITLVPHGTDNTKIEQYFMPLDDLGFNNENLAFYETGLGSDHALYRISLGSVYIGMTYHKGVFKKAGVKDIPRTQDDLLEVCQKINAVGITPMTLLYTYNWTLRRYTLMLPIMLSGDREYFDKLGQQDVLFQKGSPLTEAFQITRRLFDNHCFEKDFRQTQWQRTKLRMAKGEIGMVFLGSWLPPQIASFGTKPDEIGLFPFPGTGYILGSPDLHYGITRNVKSPRLAKAWLKFLYDEGRFGKIMGMFSVTKGVKYAPPGSEGFLENSLPVVEQANISHTQLKKDDFLASILREYLVSPNPNEVLEKHNKNWIKINKHK